jgi:hypothetical protein
VNALAPLGETVMARISNAVDLNKAQPRWIKGIFLGKAEKTDEALLGTSDGSVLTRAFRRLPDDAKYDLPVLLKMRGTPSS